MILVRNRAHRPRVLALHLREQLPGEVFTVATALIVGRLFFSVRLSLALIPALGSWFCQCWGRWRYGGLRAVVLGFSMARQGGSSDILIDSWGKAMATRLETGATLVARSNRRNNITLSTWLDR